VDTNFGEITLRFDESFLNGKGTDCCQDVAAVLTVTDLGLVDDDLQEEIVATPSYSSSPHSRDDGRVSAARLSAIHFRG